MNEVVAMEFTDTYIKVMKPGIAVEFLTPLCEFANKILKGEGIVVINGEKSKELGICMYIERKRE